MIAKATLTDKRTVVVELVPGTPLVPTLITGAPATALHTATTWATFAVPALAHSGRAIAVAATVKPVADVATAKNDTMLLYSADGVNFSVSTSPSLIA